jgi:hypothetical protein
VASVEAQAWVRSALGSWRPKQHSGCFVHMLVPCSFQSLGRLVTRNMYYRNSLGLLHHSQ